MMLFFAAFNQRATCTRPWKTPRNTLFWNLNYWDTASTLAGEVEDVKTTYPKALAIALVAVVLSYFLPLLGGLRFDERVYPP